MKDVMIHMQLDNQLPGAVFPIVISPILPPKSVAVDSGRSCSVSVHRLAIFRSTPKSRPNNLYMGLRCPSVRPSVRPSAKSFSDSDEIWYVGRGR